MSERRGVWLGEISLMFCGLFTALSKLTLIDGLRTGSVFDNCSDSFVHNAFYQYICLGSHSSSIHTLDTVDDPERV